MPKVFDSDWLATIFRDAVTPPPPPGNKKRWLDEGDIVSFTNPKQNFENAEFQINGRTDWLIWYSQLYTPYYTGDIDNPAVCSFRLKDGSYIFPIQLPFKRFWEIISGRKFRVSIDAHKCFKVNKESQKVRCLPFDRPEEIYQYVHNEIAKGNIRQVTGMMKLTSCYDLVEI